MNRILIVDDEADLELLIRHKFRKRIGAGELLFSFAQDGEQALSVLAADAGIELVVTDINMPVMDGLTLLTRIGELPRLLKTVIVSAYDDMDNIRTAMNRGAYDFLTKPVDFTDLEKTIDKTMRDVSVLRAGMQAREQLTALDYELGVATRIQRAILPEIITGNKEFEISATMMPARHVSGDFYDFFLIDSRRLGLAIGDVSGKGIPAALFMAVSRTLLRATALHGSPPNDCLDHVNQVLLKQSDGQVFLTLFYGILHLDTGEFVFSAAGQTPPYLFGTQPGIFLREPRGMMLGVLEEASFETRTVHLNPGDGLILYTDGVTEAENRDGDFFTGRKLKEAVEAHKGESAEIILSEIVTSLQTFTEGCEQGDDITLFAIRFQPGEGNATEN